MIEVVVVDDHDLVAEGLVRLLENSPHTRVTGRFRSGEDLLRRLGSGLRPDVCLIDLSMPGLGGAATIQEVAGRRGGPACIALTASTSSAAAANAVACGAVGYVTKAQTSDVLIAAIERCAAGGRFIDPVLDELDVGAACTSPRSLSPREYDVMCRLAKGERIADIADDLCLSPKTVSTHRRRILDKLGLRSNVELAAHAIEHGAIER